MSTGLFPKSTDKKPLDAPAVKAKVPVATKPAVVKAAVVKAVAAKPAVVKKVIAKPVRASVPAPAKAKPVPVKVVTPKAAVVKAKPVLPAPAVAEVKDKVKKAKLVRDSFTMPEGEYAGLGEVKKACLKAGFDVKKSELLRVGVALIRNLDLAILKTAVAGLSPLKPGRPRKEK